MINQNIMSKFELENWRDMNNIISNMFVPATVVIGSPKSF